MRRPDKETKFVHHFSRSHVPDPAGEIFGSSCQKRGVWDAVPRRIADHPERARAASPRALSRLGGVRYHNCLVARGPSTWLLRGGLPIRVERFPVGLLSPLQFRTFSRDCLRVSLQSRSVLSTGPRPVGSTVPPCEPINSDPPHASFPELPRPSTHPDFFRLHYCGRICGTAQTCHPGR